MAWACVRERSTGGARRPPLRADQGSADGGGGERRDGAGTAQEKSAWACARPAGAPVRARVGAGVRAARVR
eukprot:3620826-Prymnesium_polylepis.2